MILKLRLEGTKIYRDAIGVATGARPKQLRTSKIFSSIAAYTVNIEKTSRHIKKRQNDHTGSPSDRLTSILQLDIDKIKYSS